MDNIVLYSTGCPKCNVVIAKLNKAGLIEVQLPTLQPQKMWLESDRWQKYIDYLKSTTSSEVSA